MWVLGTELGCSARALHSTVELALASQSSSFKKKLLKIFISLFVGGVVLGTGRVCILQPTKGGSKDSLQASTQ